MKRFALISFYKYVYIGAPYVLVEQILSFCLQHKLKGKVYIAAEGINGNVSGFKEDIEKFKEYITRLEFFKDILFNEDQTAGYVFPGMHVRPKKELVNSGMYLSNEIIQARGKRLTPENLLEFYESRREFVIVDVRNRYESKIGKFRNALTPQLKNFRQWPKAVEELKEYKDKTLVTYCTGGIRCEKASGYLISQGFKDVYQLDGGIINFVKKFPDTFWLGGVFVFDDRKVIEPNTKEELKYTARCLLCGKPSAYYINCHNLGCDKIFVVCSVCKYNYDYCCSTECMNAENRREKYYD
jgi:UPF0176 protein